MSELAFNINGEAFEVPANASGWRVRKMRAKGSPEVVYAREGQPLVLPISAEIDDLRAEVDTTGRYRLDLVDQNNKPIEGAASGYVQINVDVPAASAGAPSANKVALVAHSDSIVLEAMRMNSEIAKSVVDKFPAMLEAAATLLRAADGAGMPSRAARIEIEAEEGDETEDAVLAPASQGGMDLLANLATQFAPVVVNALSGKKSMNLGAVLDWRKAAPAKDVAEAPKATTAALPALDPKTMAHVIAIQAALTPAEAALARQVAADLSPADMRTWFDELSALSVLDAVAKIRSLINAGGAP